METKAKHPYKNFSVVSRELQKFFLFDSIRKSYFLFGEKSRVLIFHLQKVKQLTVQRIEVNSSCCFVFIDVYSLILSNGAMQDTMTKIFLRIFGKICKSN
jgi:hypothetical protein